MTDVAKELIFLFFATTALKKDPGVDGAAPEPRDDRDARRARRRIHGRGHRVDRRAAGNAGAPQGHRRRARRQGDRRRERGAARAPRRRSRSRGCSTRTSCCSPAARRTTRASAARPRHRGGVRGPRAQAPRAARGRAAAARRRDLRVEHEHDSRSRGSPRRRRGPNRVLGHALLLARAQDAAARGHRDAARRTTTRPSPRWRTARSSARR